MLTFSMSFKSYWTKIKDKKQINRTFIILLKSSHITKILNRKGNYGFFKQTVI